MAEIIDVIENSFLPQDKIEKYKDIHFTGPDDDIQKVRFLGISHNHQANFYVGTDWLKEGELALIVKPKIDNVDFLTMFMHCFVCPDASKELDKIYHIDFNKPEIELESDSFELTPLLIIHYLSCLKQIVKKGLKKNYVQVEENLNSKIKGKLLFNQTLKTNICKARPDRNYCRYQEYSIDCIENRILKKALVFVSSYVNKHLSQKAELTNALHYTLSAFESVSDEVDIRQIKHIKINPLFKEYKEALRLAKNILENFSYNIEKTSKVKTKFHPFCINMPLLFELYTLSLLKSAYHRDILYQYHGKYGSADFLKISDKLIIDTKYKKLYDKDNNKFDINDIRQVSGYARDINVLKKLNIQLDNENNTDVVPVCLIIYPDMSDNVIENFDNVNDLSQLWERIESFNKIYKIGLRLPIKKDNTQK